MSPVCVTAYVQGYVFTPSFGSKAKLIKNYKAEHPFIFSADPNNISLKITKKKRHIYHCRKSTLCVSDRFLLFLFFSLCVLCPMSLSLCLSCGFPCSLSACFSASLPPWQFAIHVHSLHPHSARFCEPPASFNLWPSPAISSQIYFLRKSNKKYILPFSSKSVPFISVLTVDFNWMSSFLPCKTTKNILIHYQSVIKWRSV